MDNIKSAIMHLAHTMREQEQGTMIPFEEFLEMLVSDPQAILRNVFQIFHDMVRSSVGEGINEYPDDPENIGFVYYDCSRLFVEGADRPFFADRLFANRLVHLVEALKRGAQQNKIYVFDGPPGCGKSTFLNNLLRKFEEYANTPEGKRFEIVWRLDRKLLGGRNMSESLPVLEKLSELLEHGMHHGYEGYSSPHEPVVAPGQLLEEAPGDFVEIPCPSHDNPILVVPKEHRESFFRELLGKNGFAHELMTAKEYEWVFRETPCTICSCLYEALLDRLQNPEKVLSMVYARPYRFRRRLGEGISIFNPGDKPMRQEVLSNSILQRKIDTLFKASKRVQYLFSRYAKTNNGVYALMDIKSHNKERLIELHNIVSEGVHKVEDMEENVNSLFLAVMNPEDKKNIQDYQSFLDRIEYINIPYVLDLKTEVKIYKSIFGGHIEKSFLPMVLENFARVIISSRLNTKSEALVEWIGDPEKYSLYCDRNLHLLKMEIYTGNIPSWLSDEDRKGFTAKRRRKILAEAEAEGQKGFSGRDSLKIFNEFYSSAGKDRLIETRLYQDLHERYVYNLKERVLEPFLKNENFRRAIKDYDTEPFKTYDKRIREDITFLMGNLIDKYGYTEKGAKEVCMYVIDNDLAKTFSGA